MREPFLESFPVPAMDGVLPQAELDRLTLEVIRDILATYQPGHDRVVTPQNVYQPAVTAGRDALETFQLKLLLPGSRIEGLDHLDDCLAQLQAGKSVLFMAEHRGNLDAPSFNALLRREHPRYHAIIERLIYIAGRKLNESSDFIKMFTEKYARLVLVPRRDWPKPAPHETPAEAAAREAYEREAARINRAAFREMLRLKKAGFIFVLFPLGGRLKPDADNIPVRDTASYLHAFDTAYLISMEGNTLPPKPRMEDERPLQTRVVFRVGPALDTKTFLAEERAHFEADVRAGVVPADADFEQHVAEHIMRRLANLRLTGGYADPAPPGGRPVARA